MATPKQIRVMVSSRCNDPIQFEGKPNTLSNVRLRLKQDLESATLLGNPFFEVWINEDAPPAEGTHDAWEHCMRQVRDANIVLLLYNGKSGWAKESGDIGICHGELRTALVEAPAKVRLVELPLQPLSADNAERTRDQRFRDYVRSQSLFRGATASNGEEIIERCKQALREAVVDMVGLGGREARKGRFDTGAALDWSRLDYQSRKTAMEGVLRDCLRSRHGVTEDGEHTFVPIGGREVLVCCHAVPAAMTVATAREMVGQPFLRDHLYAGILGGDRVGPVHVIACHRNVTEAQAIRQLGFPDATVVTPPFGVYVACGIQKIQMLFIANCRDETCTRHGVQRAFEWLEQSGEGVLLSERAVSRSRIVKAVANEIPAAAFRS